jgi:hypothetical protein
MALSKPIPVAAKPPQLEDEVTCPKYLQFLITLKKVYFEPLS